MANAAYSLDFSPVAAIGRGMEDQAQDIRQAAYQNMQVKGMEQQQEMAAIQINEAKKKEQELNTPIDISTFDNLKQQTPTLYNTLMDRANSLGLIENVGGRPIIRQRGIQQIREAMDTEHAFSMSVMKSTDIDLSNKEQVLSEDLSDLQEKYKTNVDKRGNPIPNEKLQGQIAAKAKELQGIKQHRQNILLTTDETVRRQAYIEKEKEKARLEYLAQKEEEARALVVLKAAEDRKTKLLQEGERTKRKGIPSSKSSGAVKKRVIYNTGNPALTKLFEGDEPPAGWTFNKPTGKGKSGSSLTSKYLNMGQ